MEGKRPFKYWIYAAYPWAFPASISPALVGLSYAFYLYKTGVIAELDWKNGIVAILGAFFFHLAGNIMGEYHDFVNGVDQKEKTGPVRVLVIGAFKPVTILIYGFVMLLIGIAIGIYLYFQTGFPLIIMGVIGIISASLYYKFKYVALGEVVIFIVFGQLIAFGVVYVATHLLIWSALIVIIPTGLLIVAILHANNTRDLLQDQSAGIRTQAINLGLEGSQILYQTLLLAAYMGLALIVLMNLLHAAVFLVLLSFPLANRNIKLMKRATMDDLQIIQFLDVRTAQLVLIFSLLLVAGNVIAAYL